MTDSQTMDDRVGPPTVPAIADADGTREPGRSGAVGARRPVLAPETIRLYAADWARFVEYCASVGLRALPAEAPTVAAFLAAPGCDRAARSRRLAAIDHRHRQHGLPCPGDEACVRAALKAARKDTARVPRPA